MIITKLTFLTIFCIIFIATLTVVYFLKGRFKNTENRIYVQMLIANLLGLILQFLNATASYYYSTWPILISNIIFKLYLMYFVVFAFLVFKYAVLISYNEDDGIIKALKYVPFVICIPIIFLPIGLNTDAVHGINYTIGASVTYVYAMSVLLSILMIGLLIVKNKNVKRKKATPLYLFLILGFVGMLIQKSNPEMMITCYIESFICFLMYFTIENPDIKMLNELYKNKELMEQNYEDKYNFLFEMTQEARNPLVSMNSLYNEIRDTDDIKKIKDGMQKMNMLT